MINDLLIALWLDISSSLAHTPNADNISYKNRSIVKGKLFRVSSSRRFIHHFRVIVICYHNLRPVELLGRLTNPVDFVTISFNIQSENWWMVTYRFTEEFSFFGDVFESFTQHWIEWLAGSAKSLIIR